MTAARRMPALGRGMGALIPERREEEFRELEVERIKPNPYQPRQSFAPEKLDELAASIRATGVLQPILVRPIGSDGFQIVHGERRFRAAVLAGLRRIPSVIRKIEDRQMHLLALIENLQREDLDPIEEALGYQALMSAHNLTQEDISERVGRDRTTITNTLRLLRLPGEIQQNLREKKLSTGHAKALLSLDSDGEIRKAARLIVEKSLSVRQAERLVSHRNRKGRDPAERDPNTRAAEEALMRALGTKVEIKRSRRGGRIHVHFYSEEDLDRLYNQLLKGRKSEAR